MIQILVKEMCNVSLQGWKKPGNTICYSNSKGQNLKDGIKKKTYLKMT